MAKGSFFDEICELHLLVGIKVTVFRIPLETIFSQMTVVSFLSRAYDHSSQGFLADF